MDREGLTKSITELMKADIKPPCLSVYLNLSKENPSNSEILAGFNSLVHQEAAKDLSLKKDDLKQQFNQIRKTIRSLRLPAGDFRGVSIFSASNGDFLKINFLRHSPHFFRVSSSFYLSPLIREFSETLIFCFCLVDERKARLVVLSPAELLAEVRIDDQTPEKVKSAGWYGLEEKRIARHIKEHIKIHFRKVAEAVRELFKRFQFEVLVLSLHSKNSEDFKKLLSKDLAFKIVENQPVEPNASLETIRKQFDMLWSFELEQRKSFIKGKLESELAEGRAAVGLEAFIRAWNEGLVDKVIIEESFEAQAFICPACQNYQSGGGNCSLCGSKVKAVENLVEDVARRCFWKKTEIFWLKDFPYGLGAILRTYLF